MKMGMVPFSFTEVSKDVWEREAKWVGNTKKAEGRRDIQKRVRDTNSKMRKEEGGRHTGIKSLHRTEISLNEHNPSGQGCNPA